MRFGKRMALALALLAGTGGCANSTTQIQTGTTSQASTAGNGMTVAARSGPNVMTLTVNGSTCSAATSQGYQNKPCVSVTICSPGGANCQSVNDLLLDTGSSGLRVFKSVLSTALVSSLTPLTSGGQAIADCQSYVDGAADWGPVELAQVRLGGEAGVAVPIQLIDSTFGDVSQCSTSPDTSPQEAGFNGILGVGLFQQDCGDPCATNTNNQQYFSCSGATCTGIEQPVASQVTNPVALLPQDNNGVILELPSVAPGGTTSVSGYLILGIGTRSNNVPTGVTSFPADETSGEFSTTFEGATYAQSFIDSGSNMLYFDLPSNESSLLPDCGSTNSNDSGFYCPASYTPLNATNSGSTGSPSGGASFGVGNFLNLFNSPNSVFSEMAGAAGDGGVSFDWGLPFHLGRNIYVGFEGRSSGIGQGPYWAY